MAIHTGNINRTEELNKKYSIPEKIKFIPGRGGFTNAILSHGRSECLVSLYGGHVMSYTPDGKDDLLWISKCSYFEKGISVRGGIPVCWPWFGDNLSNPELPSHGFVKTCDWNVKSVSSLANFTEMVLTLTDKDLSDERLRTNPFELELAVRCGKKLELELSTFNTGKYDFNLTESFHSYFSVSDIRQVSISGLEGEEYSEKTGETRRKSIQSGPVTFSSKVARTYSGSACDCEICDPGAGRKIKISKTESRTTVLWNPWIAESAKTPDLEDNAYLEMVCVETANASSDSVMVGPGKTHRMKTVISSERF
jgi:glucose-6-phosphate 1-epimerase